MARKTKLFKIASEINIGRETIVDFLKGKGFDIENKATSSLNEDMQEAVYDKFKKERRAAEVQRTKIQKHKETKKSEEAASQPEPTPQTAVSEPEAPITPAPVAEASVPESDISVVTEVAETQVSTPQPEPKVEAEASSKAAAPPVEQAAPVPVEQKETKKPEAVIPEADSTLKESSSSSESVAKDDSMSKKPEDSESQPSASLPNPKEADVQSSPVVENKGVAEKVSEAKSDDKGTTPKVVQPQAKEPVLSTSDENVAKKDTAISEKISDSESTSVPKAGEVIDLAAMSKQQSPKPEKAKPKPVPAVKAQKPTKGTPKPKSSDTREQSREQNRKPKKDRPRKSRAADIELKPTYSGRDDDKNITKIEASAPRAADEKPDTEAPSADNKLKGLKVMGKIELKTEQPKKRKRSRKSIDVSKEIKKGKDGVKAKTGRRDDKPREGGSPRGDRPSGGAPRTAGAGPRTAGGSRPTTGSGPNFRSPAAPPRGAGSDDDRRKKKRGKSVRDQISQKDVNRAIKQTLAGIDGGSGKQSYKRRKAQKREEKEQIEQEQREIAEKTLQLTEFVTTSDLANLMDVGVTDVIAKCMMLGRMVTINQRLDKETIELIASDYEFEVDFIEEEQFTIIEDEVDSEEDLKPRPSIVTIMGHVDHGKTSLLDYIRSASVVAGEAGGITQHIGAYMVDHDGRKITFLDTPGHEAFTAMRARGAEVTDIVVLVVAADDAVMPQTLEAISHARAAEVPMVVAINKVDRPEANIEKIKQQLAEHDVLVEDWGGKFQAVPISAKFGENIDKLLESILLEAEMLDLKANPDRLARATVVEAHMDKGLGAVATVVMQKGTLEVGQPFIAGASSGRIRAMFDERQNRIQKAGPSVPVRIIGFDSPPDTGDVLIAMKSDSEAKNVAQQRQQLKREQELRQRRHVTLDDIATQIQLGGVQTLNLILKGDVSGSIEALSDSLLKLSTQEVKVNIILKGVGAISESDVQLAMASDAIVIGFHQAPSPKAKMLADNEKVEIREYDIIYDCIEDIENALEGLLAPDLEENIKGRAEIRLIYKISRMGNIAGCYVLDGKIERKAKTRLMRDGIKIWEGGIQTLKREKEDVKEVREGFECGIFLDGFNDIREEDIIETFEMVEVKRKLSQSK